MARRGGGEVVAASLWDVIEFNDVTLHEDKQALAALLRSRPADVLLGGAMGGQEESGSWQPQRWPWERQPKKHDTGETIPAGTLMSADCTPLGNPKRKNGDVDKEHCRYCGKKVHWARECRKKQCDEAASTAVNLIQAEEDDEGPGLMMACVEEVIQLMGEQAVAPTAAPPVINSATRTGGHVFLNKERAIITPTHDDSRGSEVWFLDTGATNHMTGLVNAFTELDHSVSRKVW
ncbi:hypothetical protein QYE76_033568 [Lolium multiflorum]|uniref:CCHC-type domain-containing protein n=1 Tax=Lolium multiflorum TaxID=4521 RepID=A0AAD8QWX0_LOLMU|nr:hypothetical protein QYE76_033568 [Lolium multiflorum]